ncbi:hypothetical protein BZL41_22855 [Pseudomonas sp. PIC25]|uniref:hypothetical protein n=1 Tax=Pseudomonas sp. PIC25 TaxID=1958773 RepID=UPI000BAB6E30|nr:hypothetical protein [Pseudomonas sp. PIC25]PAU54108.1 hypothetical protein BZL41_22855 [Pseudomonas sp. PIC25]
MRYIVPLELVTIALDLAKRVEQGELSRQAAYQQLVDQHGFAGHTANAYLNCYTHLRAGTPMKATVNAAGLDLMLEEITNVLMPFRFQTSHGDCFLGHNLGQVSVSIEKIPATLKTYFLLH